MKTRIPPVLIAFALVCFAVVQNTQAVSPPPDGGYPGFNTAEGQKALFSLTTGSANAAVGWYSLFSNTDGSFNTAVGAATLLFNIGDQSTGDGTQNTAVGTAALLSNTTGFKNMAVGTAALLNNTTGAQNTASGMFALFSNTTGFNNTAIGASAGANQTTGSNNVYIGAGMSGVAGEGGACYIANIFSQQSASGLPVLINTSNKLGTTTSSKRFKEDIKPMDKASEALLALRPVTFRYKKEIDPAAKSQFGLVAEDVEKVNPDLVVRDKEGKPYSVRYDQVNAMLLNEFLKEHRRNEMQESRIQAQEATIARQQKQMEALAAGLQKVSAQLEPRKPAPQTVLNNQ